MISSKTPRSGRFFRLLPLALSALGGIFALGGWLAPNHYPPWTSFHGEASAFASLGLFCLAVVVKDRHTVNFPLASWFILGLVGLIWLQWRFGLIASFGDAFLSSLYLCGFALSLWLGRQTRTSAFRDSAPRLVSALFITAAVISVYIALLQWLRLESLWGIFATERGPEMRPFGNLGQPNHLATLVMMACPLTALLLVRGDIKPWQFWTVLAALSIGLALSESRSGRLSALFIGLYLLWIARTRRLPAIKRTVFLWWVLIAGVWFIRDYATDFLLLQPGREVHMTQDQARTVMWTQMVAAIREAPWFGYGWRQTIVAQKTGALAQSGLLVTDYAHNIELDVLLWVGFPLGLILIGVAVWWLIRLSDNSKTLDHALIFASVIPFLVHSQFEFPFAYAYFLFPVGWALGFLGPFRTNTLVVSRQSTIARFGVSAFLVAYIMFCVFAGRDYLLAEEDYRVMRFELRKVGQRPSDYVAPDLHWLTQLNDLLLAGRIKPRAGMPQAEIQLLERVNQSQGWAMLHLSYIAALGMNGQEERASAELRRLRALYGDVTYGQAVQHLIDMQRDEAFAPLRRMSIP